jgi:hypothetical protein
MPATTPNPNKTAADSNGNGRGHMPQFVDLTLNAEQKARLVIFIEETEYKDLEAWVETRCSDGDTISIKPIIDGGVFQSAYICSVTGTSMSTSHNGKCLTARASSAMKALWSAMYRDTEILHGVWTVTDRRVDVDI